jgi:uncharacterized membrane protein YfcA
MDQALPTLAYTAAIFLLAGFVKGIIGLGLPTVAMGLLAAVMAPAQAASLLVLPSLITNVWQLAIGPRLLPLAARLWLMLLGTCVGTWAGVGLLAAGDGAYATVGLGIALILYAGLGLISFQLSVPAWIEPCASPLVGVATGLVTAATGVFVIPAVPYLQALGLAKDDLVQALGLSFTVSTLALAALLWRDGALETSIAGMSLAALAAALIGMIVGQQVRSRVRPQAFRLWFLVGLLLLGSHLVLRGSF